MRRFTLVPLALLIALPMAAMPDSVASVKKQLEADHKKMMKAFDKRDIATVAAMMTEDYEGIDATGMKMNKAQMKMMMKQYMDTTRKINSSTFSVTGLKVQGNKAMGKATFKLDAMINDPNGMMGKKGANHRMVMEDTSDTTWMKVGGMWKVSREKSTGQPKMTLDGKPFNPQMAAPPPPPKKGK